MAEAIRYALCAIVACLSVWLGAYMFAEQSPYLSPLTSAKLFPSQLQNFGPKASLKPNGEYNYGRWRQPIPNITFDLDDAWSWDRLTRLKKWHYTALNTDRYFVAFAVVQLNYVADVFLYVIPKGTKQERLSYSGRLPFGLGVTFTENSIEPKCTIWSPFGNEKLRVCFDDTLMEWNVKAHLDLSNSTSSIPFNAEFALQSQESMCLLFPVQNDTKSPAYVHKIAGGLAYGKLQIGDERVEFTDALAGLDWTKSVAARKTVWKWASSSFFAEVSTGGGPSKKRRIGINLSADVYDNENGESQENAIWIDGVVSPVSGVVFSVPKNPTMEKWHIESTVPRSNDLVSLEFFPQGSKEDHTNLGLIRSEFVQPYGFFRGKIVVDIGGSTHTIIVDTAFGVVEDHLAIW